jgi:hypothetical protein
MTRRARILLATLLAASGMAGFLSSSYEEDLGRTRHASSFGTLIAAIAAVPSTWCVRDTRLRYLRTSSPDRFWNLLTNNSHSDRRNAQED